MHLDFTTLPTSNHEDVLQRPGLDRGHHLIRHAKHGGVTEADHQLLMRDHPRGIATP